MGLPSASTVVWIFVLNPSRLRPIASSLFSAPFFSPRAVLVGSDDGRVDHGVLVVRIPGQHLQDAPPHAPFAPARVAQMHHPEVPETLGQVTPGYSCTIAVQHGLDEQPVVFGGHTHVTGTPGQQVLDAIPLIVSKGVSSGHAGHIGADFSY